MTITAKIICDSISPEGIRLTTMQLRYPRFIHSELMTHKVLSRNASSSRAIPVARMIEDLRRDPAMPVFWGSNKPGMQAGAELEGAELAKCKEDWLIAMNWCIERAEWMVLKGLHKQIANRILEPWAHMNTIVTATQWKNLFALRSHKDAQPEFKVLSDAMQAEMAYSLPSVLQEGQWHLPYVLASDWIAIREYAKKNRITRDEPQYDELMILGRKVSTARCARVSYLTHDGRETSVEEDIDLHDKLVVSVPLHASPAEHQATPDIYDIKDHMLAKAAARDGEDLAWQPVWQNPELHGNLVGWKQYRKMLAGEFIPG